MFYHDVPVDDNKSTKSMSKRSTKHQNAEEIEEAEDPVAKLDKELTEGKRLVEAAERYVRLFTI